MKKISGTKGVVEVSCPRCGIVKRLTEQAFNEFDFEREAIAHERESEGRCMRYSMSASVVLVPTL